MNIDKQALDRYITGNWGADQFADEIPEEFWCTECDGYDKGCSKCGGTGYNDKLKAWEEEQRKANAAMDEWMEKAQEAEEAWEREQSEATG